MNYTVQDIFDSAIRLIDEQNESTGSTETADTKPYRVKAVSLVRNLIPRVYPVSDTYAASTDGKRPVCRMPEALTDELDLDQYICESVLPWGLAALLIIDDDRDKYNAYWDEFEKGIALARNSLPSEIGEVEDVYRKSRTQTSRTHFWTEGATSRPRRTRPRPRRLPRARTRPKR